MDTLWVDAQYFPMSLQKYILYFHMSSSTRNESVSETENENSTEFLEFLPSWLLKAIPHAKQVVLTEDSSVSIPEPLKELQIDYSQDGDYGWTQLQCRSNLHAQFA